jgi:hypothetical protein
MYKPSRNPTGASTACTNTSIHCRVGTTHANSAIVATSGQGNYGEVPARPSLHAWLHRRKVVSIHTPAN